MQERGNIIPQQPTPAVLDIAPANIVAQSVGGIVDQKIGQIEEERERSRCCDPIQIPGCRLDSLD